MDARAQEAIGELRARPDQVLTAVEHEQQVLGMQRVRERREQRNGRLLADSDGRDNRLRHQRRLAQGCELYERDAVGERPVQPSGQRDGQSRLAHPGRAGQGQQPDLRSAQEFNERRDLSLTANERRKREGERRRMESGRGIDHCLADRSDDPGAPMIMDRARAVNDRYTSKIEQQCELSQKRSSLLKKGGVGERFRLPLVTGDIPGVDGHDGDESTVLCSTSARDPG